MLKNKKIFGLGKVILLFSALIFLLGSIMPKFAQATFGEIGFGGYISYLDIGSPPPAFCPAHTVFFDKKTKLIFGLMTTPGTKVYSYFNLIKPGTSLLGERDILPIPCQRYYPLYRIFQVGTSAF